MPLFNYVLLCLDIIHGIDKEVAVCCKPRILLQSLVFVDITSVKEKSNVTVFVINNNFVYENKMLYNVAVRQM